MGLRGVGNEDIRELFDAVPVGNGGDDKALGAMMNRFQPLYFFAAVFALLLCAPSTALGCSCMQDRPTCEAFGSARAVFIGKVVGAKKRIKKQIRQSLRSRTDDKTIQDSRR